MLRRSGASFLTHDGKLQVVNSIEAALQPLRASFCTVVLCEATLSEGTWKDLIRKRSGCVHIQKQSFHPVSAESALWGEVLNCGGYDLLQMPPETLFDSKAEKARNPAIELSLARELTRVS